MFALIAAKRMVEGDRGYAARTGEVIGSVYGPGRDVGQ